MGFWFYVNPLSIKTHPAQKKPALKHRPLLAAGALLSVPDIPYNRIENEVLLIGPADSVMAGAACRKSGYVFNILEDNASQTRFHVGYAQNSATRSDAGGAFEELLAAKRDRLI